MYGITNLHMQSTSNFFIVHAHANVEQITLFTSLDMHTALESFLNFMY